MMASWRAEYGARGLRLVILLVIVSFAFIPVRCDASSAPHSIFVDPVVLDSERGSHHASASHTQSEMPAGHAHHAGMHHDAKSASTAVDSDPLQDVCALTLTSGTDTSSQQPIGAALDLPTTPVPPVANALLPFEGDSPTRVSAPAIVLTGVTAPPEAPPPKFA